MSYNLLIVDDSRTVKAVVAKALKEKGVRGFLRKPFAPEDLKKMVESILGVSHG